MELSKFTRIRAETLKRRGMSHGFNFSSLFPFSTSNAFGSWQLPMTLSRRGSVPQVLKTLLKYCCRPGFCCQKPFFHHSSRVCISSLVFLASQIYPASTRTSSSQWKKKNAAGISVVIVFRPLPAMWSHLLHFIL